MSYMINKHEIKPPKNIHPVIYIGLYRLDGRKPSGILKIVTAIFNVTVQEINSKRRFRKIIDARKAYCYLCNLYLNKKWTLGELGSYINCDHATVIHHTKGGKDLFELDEGFKTKIFRCREYIENPVLNINESFHVDDTCVGYPSKILKPELCY